MRRTDRTGASDEPRRLGRRSRPRLPGSKQRSNAWLLYAGLATMSLVFGLASPKALPSGLLFAALLGGYARYIYRGGSLVIIPVPGCGAVLLLWLAGLLATGFFLKGMV